MKTFSNKVNEDSTEKYYVVEVTVKMLIKAMTDGEAGSKADDMLDDLDPNTSYEINDIRVASENEVMAMSSVQENKKAGK